MNRVQARQPKKAAKPDDRLSGDGEYEEEIGKKAWKKIVSKPYVRERLVKIERGWCNVDASSVQPFV